MAWKQDYWTGLGVLARLRTSPRLERRLLKDSDPGFLMVWALRIAMAARAFPPQPPDRFPRVEVVMPPLSTNQRMAAQAGFFTVDRSKTAPEGLDVTVTNQAKLLKPDFRHLAEPAFWQFLLPKSQAGRLLNCWLSRMSTVRRYFPASTA